jgi:hypothetical protein
MELVMNTSFLRIVSRTVYFLGVVIGVVMAVITIWSRMEAIHYFFRGATHEPFKGLRCPVMISPTEKGVVTAVFDNPTDQAVNYFYRIEMSKQESAGQIPAQVAVHPRQTKRVHFTVNSENVDLGFFVFVKMNLFPNSLRPAQEAVCGILVANLLGLSGKQTSAAALSLSFLGIVMGVGAGRLTGNNEQRNFARSMQVLALLVLLTLLVGMLGWWLAGMALSAVTILLMLISVRLAVA